MKNLIREELIKTVNYSAFKVIIILHFVFFFAVIIIPSSFQITVPGFSTDYLYQFPNVWEFIPWIASWFNILLAILIIILVCNEFSFRTFRQGVINGRSRDELFAGKGIVITAIAIYGTTLVFFLGLIFGFIFTKDISLSLMMQNMHMVLVYLLQLIAYMVLAMFIAVLIRNTALSIVLFFAYRLIIEPVIRVIFPQEARMYFPFKIITNLTPTPEFLSISSGNEAGSAGVDSLSFREMGLIAADLPLVTSILVTLAYAGLFIFLTIWILRKRNL